MVDSAMRVIHSDVAIIGGGLAGTWAAYFLRRRGYPHGPANPPAS
jgi:cation diffusion facilitator CzcD-associated flavoprotein CzcO